MFGMEMIDNYDSRKIGRFEEGNVFVSTVRVTDSLEPFETAVRHPKYNNNMLVIVEMYESAEEATAGHERWIAVMTADTIPAELKDVSTSEIKRYQTCK